MATKSTPKQGVTKNRPTSAIDLTTSETGKEPQTGTSDQSERTNVPGSVSGEQAQSESNGADESASTPSSSSAKETDPKSSKGSGNRSTGTGSTESETSEGSSPGVDDPQFEDQGGLVMSDEPEPAAPAQQTSEQKIEQRGGLLMSDEGKAGGARRRSAAPNDNPDVTLPDIAPRWESLPEDEIRDHLRMLTDWLRDRGATVRIPKETSTSDEKAQTTGKDRVTARAKDPAEPVVYEWQYEWQYEKQPPVTVRFASDTSLDALRGMAGEAYHRRHDVGYSSSAVFVSSRTVCAIENGRSAGTLRPFSLY